MADDDNRRLAGQVLSANNELALANRQIEVLLAERQEKKRSR